MYPHPATTVSVHIHSNQLSLREPPIPNVDNTSCNLMIFLSNLDFLSATQNAYSTTVLFPTTLIGTSCSLFLQTADLAI